MAVQYTVCFAGLHTLGHTTQHAQAGWAQMVLALHTRGLVGSSETLSSSFASGERVKVNMITSAAGGSVGQHGRHVALDAGTLHEGIPCAGEADLGVAAVRVAHASAVLQRPRCDGHRERASWHGRKRACNKSYTDLVATHGGYPCLCCEELV